LRIGSILPFRGQPPTDPIVRGCAAIVFAIRADVLGLGFVNLYVFFPKNPG